MTVEERAKKTLDTFSNIQYWEDLSDEIIMKAVAQALRDQIEDCAKVADEEVGAMNGVFIESTGNRAIRALAARECAGRIRDRIRALAGEKREGGER